MKSIQSKTAVMATVSLAMAIQQVSAALISVDIGPNRATSTTEITGNLHIGDLNDPANAGSSDQIGIWENSGSMNVWNYTGYSGASGLYDADGNVTTVSLAVTQFAASASNWGVDDMLSDGVYGEPQGAPILWNISGLAANQQYSLVVYHSALYDASLVTVNGTGSTAYTGSMSPASYTEGSQFWYFQVTSDGDGKLNGVSGWAPGDNTHNTFVGFQLNAIPGTSLVRSAWHRRSFLLPAPAQKPRLKIKCNVLVSGGWRKGSTRAPACGFRRPRRKHASRITDAPFLHERHPAKMSRQNETRASHSTREGACAPRAALRFTALRQSPAWLARQ
jgi:hypothetical protein